MISDNCYFLDTNSFSHYIDSFDTNIDYSFLLEWVKAEKAIVVITPHTLLEFFDRITTPEKAKTIINSFFGKDFWVINLGNVLKRKCIMEYGMDFIFEYHLHDINSFETFKSMREKLREAISESLSTHFIYYAAVLSKLHLYLKWSNARGELDDSGKRIMFYHDIVLKKNWKTLHAEYTSFGFRYNYKKEFSNLLVVLICKIESATEAMYMLQNKEYDGIEFNNLMIQLYDSVAWYYQNSSFNELEKEVKRKSHGKINNKSLLKKFITLKNKIMLSCFLYLADCGYSSKDLYNDFIDIINLNNVILTKKESVFVTEEKKWISFIFKSKDQKLNKTKDFYRMHGNKTKYKEIK